ncbi:hypothetical protein U2I83_18260 [Bacillus amyloliquefaciens]|uniref:hypothetical protein n=1 Tax=Bacillus amyloliquefaciens TaxID=1390 RepID=UPI0032DF28CA
MKEYSIRFYDQDFMLTSEIIQADDKEYLKTSADARARQLMEEKGLQEVKWIAYSAVLSNTVCE